MLPSYLGRRRHRGKRKKKAKRGEGKREALELHRSILANPTLKLAPAKQRGEKGTRKKKGKKRKSGSSG